MVRVPKYGMLYLFTAAILMGCSSQQSTRTDTPGDVKLETVQAGQFDTGKMWTFDFPPIEYFARTYQFTPTKEWFEKARLSALRLPGCSASFVSEDGLVMTNHHCARSALDSVNREGERLSEAGFYASSLEEERRASNIYVDQLLLTEDVTAEVQNAFESGTTDNEKVMKRNAKMKEIQKRSSADFKIRAPQDSMIFSVVSFYNGGRFSLYAYKRYTDVRLVYAPEEQMGFFGGDPDNFTYPRYDFDCSFFRVYDRGIPLKTAHFYRFSQDGAKEGDAVFVIGNPGSTSRLLTLAQLESLRDITYPASIESNRVMGDMYSSYVEKHPEARVKYINTIFGLANSRKRDIGYLNGLTDPALMARKKDFEKKLRNTILANEAMKTKYGDPWSDIAGYQSALDEIAPELNVLRFRGRYNARYLSLASELVDAALRKDEDAVPNPKPRLSTRNFVPEIETQLLAFRLTVMNRCLGGKNAAFDKLMAGRTPEQAAKEIASSTVIGSREKMAPFLSDLKSVFASSDPLITFFVEVQPRLAELQQKSDELTQKLQARVQVLGKALYEVYGTSIPPDATFTLRIADGTVKSYEYNGTIAPPTTTFYGMYDRYYSFGKKEPWSLPDRWVNPPSTFKMGTPMNFISTNDIIGGNSGSPVINKNLQVVGVIFDGNIESLPGNVLFDETKNRSVSVQTVGILEGLEQIYKADRLAKELRAGKIAQ